MDLCNQIAQTFLEIESFFTEQDLKAFRQCNYYKLSIYHFGLGTWIRNQLLKDGSDLTLSFMKGGIFHKDDMSALIITLFYIYIHESTCPKEYGL